MKTAEAFWACVQKTDHCWLWTKYRNRRGYGRVNWKGTNWYAHRLAWFLTNGQIPDGLNLLHSCDNPPCCRPDHDHVGLGTHTDNMGEAAARKRMATRANGRWNGSIGEQHWAKKHPEMILRGEKNPCAKLTDVDVSQIRGHYSDGAFNQYELAEMYHVSQRTILSVVRGKRWTHVPVREEVAGGKRRACDRCGSTQRIKRYLAKDDRSNTNRECVPHLCLSCWTAQMKADGRYANRLKRNLSEKTKELIGQKARERYRQKPTRSNCKNGHPLLTTNDRCRKCAAERQRSYMERRRLAEAKK